MKQETLRYTQLNRDRIRETVCKETGVTLIKRNQFSNAKKFAVGLAVFIACFLVATPALAANIPETYYLLYRISPATAQFFHAVQMSAVDQGIEVKVESAYIHGAEAEAVVSVRDLTGNRLDKSIDFDDTYDFRTGFDSFGTCSQISYDEATKTATFLIQTSSMDKRNVIAGEKISLTFQTLLTEKTETLGLQIPLDWSAIPETVKTEYSDQDNTNVLIQGESMLDVLDGFSVTGIGYVDGKLHIQLYTPRRYKFNDYAFLYLLDEQGNRTEADMLYRGGYNVGDAKIERSADYVEYAFDVPKSELAQYRLYGEFYSYKTRIDGNWSITFPLKQGNE